MLVKVDETPAAPPAFMPSEDTKVEEVDFSPEETPSPAPVDKSSSEAAPENEIQQEPQAESVSVAAPVVSGAGKPEQVDFSLNEETMSSVSLDGNSAEAASPDEEDQ